MKTSILILFVFSSLLLFSQKEDFNTINFKKHGEAGLLIYNYLTVDYNVNLDKNLKNLSKALKISKAKNDSLLITASFYYLATINHTIGNTTDALKNIDSSLKYAKLLKLDGYIGVNYDVRGAIKREQRKFNEAINDYKKSIEHTKDERIIYRRKVNISAIYYDLGDYNSVKLFTHEAINYYKENGALNRGDSLFYGTALLNSGSIPKQIDENLKQLNQAGAIFKDINNKEQLTLVLLAKAVVYIKNKRIKEGLDYFNKVIVLAKQENYLYLKTFAYAGIAETLTRIQQPKAALAYLDSTNLKLKNGPFLSKINVDTSYYKVYKALGDYKKADYHLNKYNIYLTNLLKDKSNNDYAEFTKKYETDKKTAENKQLLQEKEIQNLKLKNETNLRYLLLAIMTMILISAFLFYNRLKINKKYAAILENKNKKIESKNTKLTEANTKISLLNDKLSESNATKDRIFQIISHDLINPFNSLVGYTNILNNDFENVTKSEQKEFFKMINEASKKNYKLTKNLLDWARTQQNSITVSKSLFSLKEVIESVINTNNLLIAKKKLKLIIVDHSDRDILSDINIFQSIFYNLLNNAIKYSNFGDDIIITIETTLDNFIVELKDHGIGMDKSTLDNFFSYSKKSKIGTQYEKGTGLGLIIVKEFLELLNGKIEINSYLNKGTIIKLLIKG